MNEKQYEELCKLTDEVLQVPDATPVRVAIPWLHIIREHPVFLVDYEGLFTQDNKFIYLVRTWRRSICNKLGLIRVLLISVILSDMLRWSEVVDKLACIDILFISHLMNRSQFNDKDDLYYSDLPQKLKQDGYIPLTVMLNHTKVLSTSLYDRQNSEKLQKVVFSKNLGFFYELKNIRRLWMESRSLKKSARLERHDLKKKILFQAAREALSPSSLHAMRLETLVRTLVEKTRTKVLIATHEGHAWERLAFYSARQANPVIKCIGYMQAPLFQRQHAVKRNLGKDYNPDMIFTSGPIQKKQLDSSLPKKIPVNVLGSRRCFDKKAMSHYSRNELSMKNDIQKACLVIPEGIESEIHLLFEFSLKCAWQYPHVNFIWRLHPLFSFEVLTARNRTYRSVPGNIELSDRELDIDLNRCNWVLYRGSSAVIQAVVAGLRPIYLHVPGQMRIDPLYELDEWKIEIETTKDFMSVLRGSACDGGRHYQKARDYCLKTYVPFDYSTIINTLSRN